MKKNKTNKPKSNELQKEPDLANSKKSLINIVSSFEKHEFEKISNIIGIISSILIGLYFVLNTLYKVAYQGDCEDFFNIPGKYFVSSIDNKAIYLILIILCIIIFFSPSLLKKRMEKSGEKKSSIYLYIISLIIILGLFLGLLNFLNLFIILEKINQVIWLPQKLIQWISRNIFIIIFVMVIFSIATLILFILNTEVKRIRFKIIKKVIFGIGILSYLISASLYFGATVIKLSTNIEDKIQYETFIIDDKNMVVLSEKDDKLLAVEYDVINGKATFFTDKYIFIDYNNIYISYKKLGPDPDIITGN